MGTNKREPDDWSRAVAAQVAAERAALRLTQAEVIERTGLSRSTYLRIEAGVRPADVTELAKIATAYGLSTSQILMRAEERFDHGGNERNQE